MSEKIISNGNGVLKNVTADNYAAQGGMWGVTTHFDNERFALSAADQLIKPIKSFYPKGTINVVGLCAGDGYYERTVCEQLSNAGFLPNLFITDLQKGSLDSVPKRESILPVMADARHLPFANGNDRSTPVLEVSRAYEHYLNNKALQEVMRENARILKPGEMYFSQISSGDYLMHTGFSKILKQIAGKNMRYFTEADYVTFMNQIGGNSRLFNIKKIGMAEPQPRGSLQLARRYLNENFLKLNETQLKHRGISPEQFIEETEGIKLAELDLSQRLHQGNITKEEATNELDSAIKSTGSFAAFQNIIVDTVDQHLQGQHSPHLTLHDNDVTIDVQYPIFQLQRTENPVE